MAVPAPLRRLSTGARPVGHGGIPHSSYGANEFRPVRMFRAATRRDTDHSPRMSPGNAGGSTLWEDPTKGWRLMTIGPVQLIVLGFRHPDFHGEVIAELERLRATDTIRVIDAIAVYKDAAGEITAEHLSNLTTEEAIELGSKVGALIGLGFEGEEGAEAGARMGAEAAAAGGVTLLDDAGAWDVLADIPNDSAAALLLIEHHWAVPLRNAIARAGGFRLSDGFISPFDLVEIGLVSAAEAKELADLEQG
jgi:uncharacterized membrane protein